MQAGNSSEGLSVVPVTTAAHWHDFHHLPYSVYRDDPQWVAPLLLERKFHFQPSHNPYFQHAKVACWLAYRGKEPVGRITAQVDELHLAQHQDATGHFGFIEATDDPAVFAALLETAESWLKAQGMKRSVGPVSFSLWDEPGLLVEGFNTPPCVLMGHHRPYYQKHISALGYAKLQDLLAYDHIVEEVPHPTLERIISRAKTKLDFKLREIRMDSKNFKSEVRLILDIVNDAWSDNWGFVPMTDAEIDDMAGIFKVLLRPDAVVFAEYEGEAIAFALTLPNINEAIRDFGGKLFPLNVLKLLWRLKVAKPKSVRMPLMGVRKKWQNTSIGGALAYSMIQHARLIAHKHGAKRGEMSWILETNKRLHHMLTLVGGTVYKRYRIYEKPL